MRAGSGVSEGCYGAAVLAEPSSTLSRPCTHGGALDAETGTELWTFDPKAYQGGYKGAGSDAALVAFARPG